MKKILIPIAAVAVAAAALLANFSTPMAGGDAQVGSAAPDFTLTDTNGNSVTLSDYSGKYVVLEWINYDCPFVVKHYQSKNMQGPAGQVPRTGRRLAGRELVGRGQAGPVLER